MKKVNAFYKLIWVIIVPFMLMGCNDEKLTPEKSQVVVQNKKATLIDPNSPWVDSVYTQLTWNQKLAQLIWINPDWNQLDSLTETFYNFGGLVLPNDSSQYKVLKNYLQQNELDKSRYSFMLKGAPNESFLWDMLSVQPYMVGINGSNDDLFIQSFFNTVLESFQRENCHFVMESQDTNSFWKLSPQKQKVWQQLMEQANIAYVYSTKKNYNPQLQIHCLMDGDTLMKDSDSSFNYHITSNWKTFSDSLISGSINLYISNKDMSPDSLNGLVQELSIKYKETPQFTLKIRKILALKEFALKNSSKFDTSLTFNQHWNIIKTSFLGLAHQTHHTGNALLNSDNALPLKQLPKKKWTYLSISSKPMIEFTKGIKHYAEITEVRKTNLALNLNDFKNQKPLIIVLNEPSYTEAELQNFIKKVREFSKTTTVIVAGINLPFGEHLLEKLPNYIHCPITSNQSQYSLAQSIVGGISINGLHPLDQNKKTFLSEKIRFSYTIPEEVGINADSIKKIDKIAAEAIFSNATPGCQVFVAKEGKVIYNKGFGYHAYDYKTAVNTNDVYDIASVTKVAGTTMCAMHLYEKGKYQLTDSIKSFLPDTLNKFLKHPSRLGNITFQELLTHQSGLPSGLPIHKFIAYVNKLIGRFDRYYCDASDHYFCVEVAKDFYLDSAYLDSLWVDMNRIWPGEKTYKYSDANMNTLYQVFRRMIKGKKTYDRYLDSVIYEPLNLNTIGFLPLKYLDTLKHRIAPTEYDTYWRYQVIKGHVHDPNAALYGGVAGNAGLFSNAQDLGVLFQLLLNGGSYGGKQLFKPETVELFTQHYPGSHRGLGFDKPIATSGNIVAKDAPYTSYGHSGFTGICAWADKENELVFVFTSNRVHPNPMNKKLIERGIRGRMHQVIYNQLFYNGTYKNSATKNIPYSKMAIDSTLLVTTP